MKHAHLIAFILLISMPLRSQNSVDKQYFKDQWGQKSTSEEKAKYCLETRQVNDSIRMQLFVKLKPVVKVWEKQYLNDEPYGEWIFYAKDGSPYRELDYRFELKYGNTVPDDCIQVDYKNKRVVNMEVESFDMPVLENNENGLLMYLMLHTRYPTEAQEQGIQGSVHVQFCVNENGSVSDISIVRGVHKALDREAFRLIHSMPNWQPAKVGGVPKKVSLIVPIHFKLA